MKESSLSYEVYQHLFGGGFSPPFSQFSQFPIFLRSFSPLGVTIPLKADCPTSRSRWCSKEGRNPSFRSPPIFRQEGRQLTRKNTKVPRRLHTGSEETLWILKVDTFWVLLPFLGVCLCSMNLQLYGRAHTKPRKKQERGSVTFPCHVAPFNQVRVGKSHRSLPVGMLASTALFLAGGWNIPVFRVAGMQQ